MIRALPRLRRAPRRTPWAHLDEDALAAIAARWTRVGAYFGVRPARAPVDLEQLIVDTARAAPDDERLFVVAASWLAVHHAFVNGRRLAGLASGLSHPEHDEASAVLGALLGWAGELAGGADALTSAAARCRPLAEPRPLFRVVALLPSVARRLRDRADPRFLAWGLWYATPTRKPEAVRPVAWLLAHAPELRVRALAGPTLEADVLAGVLLASAGPAGGAAPGPTVRDLARDLAASYAATHEAADKLVRRGVLTRERDGVRQVLRATPLAKRLLGSAIDSTSARFT